MPVSILDIMSAARQLRIEKNYNYGNSQIMNSQIMNKPAIDCELQSQRQISPFSE